MSTQISAILLQTAELRTLEFS